MSCLSWLLKLQSIFLFHPEMLFRFSEVSKTQSSSACSSRIIHGREYFIVSLFASYLIPAVASHEDLFQLYLDDIFISVSMDRSKGHGPACMCMNKPLSLWTLRVLQSLAPGPAASAGTELNDQGTKGI